MALAIPIGMTLICRTAELLLKDSKVMMQAYLTFISHAVKLFNLLYFTNKTECFSFKSGCAMQALKLVKEYSVTVKFLA